MTSNEKVQAVLDRVQELQAPRDAAPDPGAEALRLALTMFRPVLETSLPPDPRDLDDLLQRGSEWLLTLRSDGR